MPGRKSYKVYTRNQATQQVSGEVVTLLAYTYQCCVYQSKAMV